ncbi:hypothetical protein SGRA_3135 [Saprospira grandis str. Lewin]|uniref:Uncharacterized protein n=1 Tax=Saprospira grandis (strain Lewin) TaxID=984262 RepID=H6KZT7_SAPGL|nr:hypothetical protein SGRA_3135 [Saprospira grandis str. Lewin]
MQQSIFLGCCFFRGLPALRAGRAVPRLAGLLGPAVFSLRSKNFGLPLRGTAIHP